MTWQKILVGDARDKLREVEPGSVQLIVSSPPYNVGKNYEVVSDELELDEYLKLIKEVVTECFRVVWVGGSVCF